MSDLTHIDARGQAHMVDVSAKTDTVRTAVARGRISMSPAARAAIGEGIVAKGDVLATARIAGIMAAKKTADLIPLCHPLPLSSVSVDLDLDETGVVATATARISAKTGVEMEAMTAVSVALLTIYDMVKAIDKGMIIEDISLVSKHGGKSGDWIALQRPAS